MPGLSSIVLAIVAVLVLALPFLKGDPRRHCETLVLLVCTLAVLLFFGQLLKSDSHPGKVQSQVSEERAESALRLVSIVNVGLAKVYSVFGPLRDSGGKEHTAIDVSNTGLSSFFKTAENSLQFSIQANPGNSALKAKLVVLLSCWGKHKDLLKSTCESLKNSQVEAEKKLGEVLFDIYLQPASSDGDPALKRKIIEDGIPRGWYQENAILSLYRSSKQFKSYENYRKELEERYSSTFRLGLLVCTLGGFFAFVGAVVVVIQLGSIGRKEHVDQSQSEGPGLELDLRTIYTVFVGWMTSQLAIGEAFKLLPKNMLSLGGNALGVAAFSLISYLISMIPALLLIYFVALKPRGLSFFSALKIRLKTPKMGLFKLLACGFLGWCAIIPLVILGSILASMLGSQGSDNPILPQIALVASSRNLLAIGMLYFTVAVMAPFCEEVIFRGFLYSSLRNKLGIFPAILISSLIFAFIHFDKGGTLMLCALGPVLALALERTRSLVPSMVSHGLWNGCAFAVTLSLYYS